MEVGDPCEFWEKYLTTQDDVDREMLLLQVLEKHVKGCYVIYRKDPVLGSKCVVGVFDSYIQDLLDCITGSMVVEE